MKELKWSRTQTGNLNAKIGGMTLYVIAYHRQDGYYVHPKLPGQKSVKVKCYREGQYKASQLYNSFLKEIM